MKIGGGLWLIVVSSGFVGVMLVRLNGMSTSEGWVNFSNLFWVLIWNGTLTCVTSGDVLFLFLFFRTCQGCLFVDSISVSGISPMSLSESSSVGRSLLVDCCSGCWLVC